MGRLFAYIPNNITIQHQYNAVPETAAFQMHVHDHHELYYFLSGRGEFYVEGTRYLLEPGCMLLMQPGESHQVLISQGEPYERITVHFFDRMIDHVTSHKELLPILNRRPMGVGSFYPADQLNQDMIRNCFQELQRLLDSGLYQEPHQLHMVLFSYLLPIFWDLQHYYFQEGKNAKLPDDDPINTIITYINGHLADDISVEQLSKQFFISKSTLNQKFKKVTGTSVWNFILTKRLVHARIQILDGSRAHVAAQENGFHDYSSFYRRYVEKFGVSPTQSRSQGQ